MAALSFQGKNIRTVTEGGTVWFVVTDIAKALGLVNPSEIVESQVADKDKRMVRVDTLGGEQSLLAINYLGVYEIILGSRSDAAADFEAWFTKALPGMGIKPPAAS